MKYELLNGSNLSYIGDAYYELMIRNYLISKNITKSKELQKICIEFVSASSQCYIYNELQNELTEEEKVIFLRGRNGAHLNRRKNVDSSEYITASGYEAIIGYLYLKKDLGRLNEIIDRSIKIVEKKNGYLW